jgi:hypothetical protein
LGKLRSPFVLHLALFFSVAERVLISTILSYMSVISQVLFYLEAKHEDDQDAYTRYGS